ncbi:MAG: hypothetical protein AAF558_11230 [Verrucomicrobiota bacterium]
MAQWRNLGKAVVTSFICIWLLIFSLSCRQYNGGTAPDGSFQERHEWGERHLGPTYLRIREWASNSKVIRSRIGEVEEIAPIGDNPTHFAFTDGWSCDLQLEVVGTEGDGTLEAFGSFIDSSTQKLFFSVKWTDAQGNLRIHPDDITFNDYYAPEHYLPILDQQVKSSSTYPDPVFRRAQVHLLLHHYDKAEADIRDALKKLITWNPRDHRTHREYLRTLAIIVSAADQPDLMESAFQELSDLTAQYNYERGNDYLLEWMLRTRMGQTELAKVQLKNRLDQNRDGESRLMDYVEFKEVAKFIFDGKLATAKTVRWTSSQIIAAHLLIREEDRAFRETCLESILEKSSVQRRTYIDLYAEWLLNRTSF